AGSSSTCTWSRSRTVSSTTGRSRPRTSHSLPNSASPTTRQPSSSPKSCAGGWPPVAPLPVAEPEVPAFRPQEIVAVLARHGVDYVLIGGFAAVAHGAPHVTVDVDITP